MLADGRMNGWTTSDSCSCDSCITWQLVALAHSFSTFVVDEEMVLKWTQSLILVVVIQLRTRCDYCRNA